MKIGIVNTGGDAPGLNAVIAAAVKYGVTKGHTFVGFMRGWEGILDKDFIELDKQTVRGTSHLGGTILKTTNKGRFAGKKGAGEVNIIDPSILQLAKDNLEELGVEILIEIGGDAGLSAAKQLNDIGVKMVCAPKTIDNDLRGTDKTFGFGTAVDIAAESIDRIHTTATSHDRVIVVETMGRHVGWIALFSGLASGADIILIPEIKFSYEKILEVLKKRKAVGKNSSIIVVSEGAKAENDEIKTLDLGGTPEVRLGGISATIVEKLEQLAPEEFELRNVVLGHIQRGGAPNAQDKIISKTYGVGVIDAIDKGLFSHMVAIRSGKTEYIEIEQAITTLNFIDENSLEFQTAKKIGVSFGN